MWTRLPGVEAVEVELAGDRVSTAVGSGMAWVWSALPLITAALTAIVGLAARCCAPNERPRHGCLTSVSGRSGRRAGADAKKPAIFRWHDCR